MALDKDQQIKLNVLIDVDDERTRQDTLWGKQRHDHGTWLMILGEEYGEVCQAMQKKQELGKINRFKQFV